MRDWAAKACDLLAAGEPAALVSILAAEGSTPRPAGVRMIVTLDKILGSVGGGNLEHQAINQARHILGRPRGEWRVQDYPLGPLLGQCCGGRVRLLLEHLGPEDNGWLSALRDRAAPVTLETRFAEGRLTRSLGQGQVESAAARGAMPSPGERVRERIGEDRRPVLLFGAGHVGLALAKALAPLPFDLAWFDSRPEAADVAGVALASETELVAQVARAGPQAAILIMTHDHGLDYRLVAAALAGPASFIGLIGSRTKKARFQSRLERCDLGEAARARLVCPVGLDGVIGKEPEVIAVAVAAQLLTLRGASS